MTKKVPYHGNPDLRLWKRVSKNGPVHPVLRSRCWVWTGFVHPETGYGMFKVNSKPVRVHRFSYELNVGPIGPLWVLHKCDNRVCVRPDHLFIGSPTDNHKDMVAKGRHAHGERNAKSKLTTAQVLEARKVYKRRCPINGCSALAKRYGVNRNTITRAVKGELWKQV